MTAFACALALLAPTPSLAALIDGSQLNITGAGRVGATFLIFQCNQPGDAVCASPPPGKGDFAVANSTGSFTQYNTTFGLITSINNAAQPLNTPISLMNFMTFDLNNNITIELTFIPLGNDPASTNCAGLQHCTPQSNALITANNPQGLSAFNLDANQTGTAAVFGIRGIAHANDGTSANLAGTFTTQFTGLNPQQALAVALAGNPQTYSANLVITLIPEPGATFLVGLGLLGLGLIGRRHGRRT